MKQKKLFLVLFSLMIGINTYANDLQISQLEERILQGRKLDFSFQDNRFQFGITSKKGYFSKKRGELSLICYKDSEGIRSDLVFHYVVKTAEGKGKKAVWGNILIAQNLRFQILSSSSLAIDLSQANFYWEHIAPETHPLLNSIEKFQADNLQEKTWFWMFSWLETVGTAYSRENEPISAFYLAID